MPGKTQPRILTLTCMECGKTFERESRKVNRRQNHFCTPECRRKWHERRRSDISARLGTNDRSDDIVEIAQRIARLGLEQRLDREEFASLISLVAEIAFITYGEERGG